MPKGYYENLRDQMSPEEWKRLHQGSFEAVGKTMQVFDAVIVVPTGDESSAEIFPINHHRDSVGLFDTNYCVDNTVVGCPEKAGVYLCRVEIVPVGSTWYEWKYEVREALRWMDFSTPPCETNWFSEDPEDGVRFDP